MVCRTVEVRFPQGLHVGPANQLAKLAKGYPCAVTLQLGGRRYSGKSVFNLLKLGAARGQVLELCCAGEAEGEALEAVAAFFEEHENSPYEQEGFEC